MTTEEYNDKPAGSIARAERRIKFTRELAIKVRDGLNFGGQDTVPAKSMLLATNAFLAADSELDLMKTAGIIEIAVRNPNVADWLKHWEDRATKAEARVAEFSARGENQTAYAEGIRSSADTVRSMRATEGVLVQRTLDMAASVLESVAKKAAHEAPAKTLWEVEEYKVWKGIDPEKPTWAGLNIVTDDWDNALGYVDYLSRNGAVVRVGKSKRQFLKGD